MRGVSFRIDARTRKNVGVDPQEPPRDETGVDATGVALNEVQLGKLALMGLAAWAPAGVRCPQTHVAHRRMW